MNSQPSTLSLPNSLKHVVVCLTISLSPPFLLLLLFLSLSLSLSEQALERRLSRGAGGDSALVNSLQPFDDLIAPEIENLRLLYAGQHLWKLIV